MSRTETDVLAGPELTDEEQDMLDGGRGPAVALAMRLVLGIARASGASRLLEIDSAHIDGCLYHGRAGLDLAERLVELGGAVAVRSTLNVGSLDLLQSGIVRPDDELGSHERRLMDAYMALGCEPTWSCAPYQLSHRSEFGRHVAWAESNAIAFVNSVLGARTDRYGDFIDIAAVLTGRVPDAGLHRDAARQAQLVLDCLPSHALLAGDDTAWVALGALLGAAAGTQVAALTGLPGDLIDGGLTEDRLKALGATAASVGGVALFHAVGITPEAPTLDAAAALATHTCTVAPANLRGALERLTTTSGDDLDAVSLGTPHFSVSEFAALAQALGGGPPFAESVTVYVATSRAVLAEADRLGHLEPVRAAGARVLTDTCTYVTPTLETETRTVMTNSGKWAWYAPQTWASTSCSAASLTVWRLLGRERWCVMTAVGDEAQSIFLTGTPLTEGVAVGSLQLLDEALSFWGGVDAHGRICDVHHPQRGTLLGGTVLLMPSGRGSSSSAAVLAEQIRAGTAPAAIVLREFDGILVAGALVAAELYGVRVPVLTLRAPEFDRLASASPTDRAIERTVTARVAADDRSAHVTFQGA